MWNLRLGAGTAGKSGRETRSVMNIDINQVIRENFDRIHRAALVLSGNPWDADDLAQETFLVFAQQPGKFQGKSAIYTWLYGILLNLDRRDRRQWGTRQRKLRVLWSDESRREAENASVPIETAEWKASLWSRVAKLPEGQRQALVLRFSEGLPYDEIAVALSCPLGTVKSRIFHGLLSLRGMMSDADEEIAVSLGVAQTRSDGNELGPKQSDAWTHGGATHAG